MNFSLIKKFRNKIKKGKPIVSSWSQISNANLAEILWQISK